MKSLSMLGGAFGGLFGGGVSSSIGGGATNGGGFGTGAIGGALGGINAGGSSGSTGGGGGFLGFNIGSILGSLTGLFSSISCWGASWTPKRAKNYTQSHIQNTNQKLQLATQNLDYSSLERINQVLYEYKQDYIDEASWIRTSSPGRCSKKSITAMLPVLDNAFVQMTTVIQTAYQNAGKPVQIYTKPLTKRMLNWNVPQFKPKEISIISNPIGSIINGLKKFGGGLLLPLAILGTLVYWWVNPNDKKSKKRKTQWFRK